VLPVAGVSDVEFWNSIVQLGRFVRNQFTKWSRTATIPGVPGTRGTRIGARIGPFLMSKSAPADGRLLSVLSDRGVYAAQKQKESSRIKARSRGDAIMNVEAGMPVRSYLVLR
jgi:hypothetical protein